MSDQDRLDQDREARPDTASSVGDATVRSDEADAVAAHAADRPPTPDEESAAPTEVDPAVAEAYEDAMERGAAVRGEGQIEP